MTAVPSFDRLDRIARAVASAYRRRCSWVDTEELRQEAWVAMLLARRSYRPALGPFEPYARRAAQRWLRGLVWSSSKPVSASLHDLNDLRSIRGVPVDDRKLPTVPPPEVALETKQHAAQVRAAVTQALGEGSQPSLQLIVGDRALNDFPPEERARLHKQVSEARAKLSASRELWKVWRGSDGE